MPVAPTYPGVYIEEIPSGVHTITGVATSIAAFVGWAAKGPTNQAVLILSFSDFQNQFGGLDPRSNLGYAVNHFFANGGQQAYIVRVVWDGTLPPASGTSPTPCATARAVGVGLAMTTISATLGAISGSTTLTVGTPILQQLAITPATPPFLQVGQALQLKATGSYSDGSTKDLTNSVSVTWNSSAAAMATVSASGLVTAVTAGNAIVTAASGAVTESVPIAVTAATLATIAVTPASPSIALGQKQQFTATGTYSDGKTQDLTASAAWSSATSATATIDAATGLATSVAAGTSAIKATMGNLSDQTTLTVTAGVLQSITVTPANPPWLNPNGKQQFTATGGYSDGTTKDLSGTATWNSSSNLVATVDSTGLAKAVAVGAVLITATSGGVSGSANLSVTTATLARITVSPAAPTIAAGQTLRLKAQGTYSDNSSQDLTASAAWTSATASAATVDSTGLVKGVAAGTSQMTAALSGVSGKNTVTVVAPVLTGLAVTPANPSIASGQTQQFKATGTFSDGSSQELTASVAWASSLPAVATVVVGLATAKAAGSSLTLFARSPGLWGNDLQVKLTPLASDQTNRFSIQVMQGTTTVLESFYNLSWKAMDPQYVVTVIDNDSQYITFIDPATGAAPSPLSGMPSPTTGATFSGGLDGATLTPQDGINGDGNFELALGSDPAAVGNQYGIHLLDHVPIFNLLCVPGETDPTTIQNFQTYCRDQRAFCIVDCPVNVTANATPASTSLQTGPIGSNQNVPPGQPQPALTGKDSINSAYYFPWIQAPDPVSGNRLRYFPPCGFVAGNYAATDAARGVWKAPAGIDTGLSGASGLQYVVTDAQNGALNIHAINCLRQFRVYGNVIWGARTLQGDDEAGSEWKYLNIRRFALFLESSLYDGTQWVVFEPNDETLWGQIRLNVGAFMQRLFLQGAFQGTTPQQAYFVKCDSENNPQSRIDLGIVTILVGFAPLYPAEFVVIQIQQMAGQI
jgi:phage tail sheath protein FI